MRKVVRDAERFSIEVAPGKFAFLEYRLEDDNIVILSTFTPEEFRGKGLAAKLMRAAVSFAVKNRLKIVPECSYAREYLKNVRNRNFRVRMI